MPVAVSPSSYSFSVFLSLIQRLMFMQTASGDVGISHIPCILVTLSEQRLTPHTAPQ